jgi:hypothetical protein
MGKLRNLVNDRMAGKQNALTSIPALLGKPNGEVEVPGQPGWNYARVGDQLVEVYNPGKVPAYPETPVLIGYDPLEPDILQVLNVRSLPTPFTSGVETINVNRVPEHADTHTWMSETGNDPVFIDLRQIMPLRVTPAGGMLIFVHRAITNIGSAVVEVSPSTTYDLSTYVPNVTAGDARYVLVSLNDVGGITLTAGTLKTLTTLTLADIPACPTGHRRLAAVRLYYGQTIIYETRLVNDLVDLRFVQEPGVPSSHASTHQNGGVDEISIAGLSGQAADPQTPLAHASTHVTGGADALVVDNLQGKAISATAPANGQTLIWNETNQRYEPASGSGTPTAHASTHQSGGSDPIALDTLSAPTDITTLNASATAHGLLPKLSNVAAQFLNGLGAWVAVAWGDITGKPTSFTPEAHSASHKSGGTDAIALDTLAAPTDVTTLNASTVTHGLLPKLSGIATQILNGAGAWVTAFVDWANITNIPSAFTPTTHTHAGTDITSIVSEANYATYSGTADSAVHASYAVSAWIPEALTCSYLSASSISVSGTVTDRYPRGTKFRCKQGGAYLYFRVLSAVINGSTTTVTLEGGGVYSLANAAITDAAYSYAEEPEGFPVTSIADVLTPAAHTHAGSDISSSVANADAAPWTGITGKPTSYTPAAHASSHQNGGADEISVAGLSGLLADNQHVETIYCRVARSTAQSIATQTWTPIQFDTQVYDDTHDHWTSANNSKIYARVAGYYMIFGHCGFEASSTGERRYLALRVNGTTYIAQHGATGVQSASYGPVFSIGTMFYLSAGDYVELVVYQNAGTINTSFDSSNYNHSNLALIKIGN